MLTHLYSKGRNINREKNIQESSFSSLRVVLEGESNFPLMIACVDGVPFYHAIKDACLYEIFMSLRGTKDNENNTACVLRTPKSEAPEQSFDMLRRGSKRGDCFAFGSQ